MDLKGGTVKAEFISSKFNIGRVKIIRKMNQEPLEYCQMSHTAPESNAFVPRQTRDLQLFPEMADFARIWSEKRIFEHFRSNSSKMEQIRAKSGISGISAGRNIFRKCPILL